MEKIILEFKEPQFKSMMYQLEEHQKFLNTLAINPLIKDNLSTDIQQIRNTIQGAKNGRKI